MVTKDNLEVVEMEPLVKEDSTVMEEMEVLMAKKDNLEEKVAKVVKLVMVEDELVGMDAVDVEEV